MPSETGRGGAAPISAPAEIAVGALMGADTMARLTALSGLCFSGALAAGQPMALKVFLLASAAMTLLLLLRGQVPNASGIVQDVPLAIMAPALAAGVGTLAVPAEARLVTAFAAMGLTSALTGTTLFLLGRFRLSAVVRFLPFPVLAGFLSGSGYLMGYMTLSGLLTGGGAGPGAPPPNSGAAIPLLAAVAVALLLVVARLRGPVLLWPLLVLVLIGGTHFVTLFSQLDADDLRALGLLNPPPPADGTWILLPLRLDEVSGMALQALVPTVLTASLVSVAAFLITVAGVELATGRDIAFDRELQIAGLSNLAVAPAGALPAYMSASMTLQAEALHARRRLTPAMVLCTCLGGLFFAAELTAFVPRFVQMGVVLAMAALLLNRWLIALYNRLPATDWAIVLAILAVTAWQGMLAAIVAGLLIATVTFAIRYARVPVIRQQGDGRLFRSKVDRSAQEERLLDAEPGRIQVMSVQGFLFFGSIEQLVSAGRRAVAAGGGLKALVLDFERVSGIEPTALSGLRKLLVICRGAGVTLHVAAVPPQVAGLIRRSDLLLDEPDGLTLADDLDALLERLENLALARHPEAAPPGDIHAVLADYVEQSDGLEALIACMERLELPEGTTIIRAGDDSGDIFFVASGRVSVYLRGRAGARTRLRSMGAGAIVGEVASYTGKPRTADVCVDTASVLYVLRSDAVKRIDRDSPRLAAVLHRLIAASLSEKIARTNASLSAAC
jgi:SulP family sulfate permease